MVLWIFVLLLIAFVVLPIIGAAVWWVISTAIVGIFLGGLARLIVPGRQNIGLLATIVCGWIGSIGGGLIGGAIWGFHFHHHHHWFGTLLIEIGVAALAVGVWSAATHNRPRVNSSGSRYHRIIDI
jgi:uncharacterized membrane protein YeaQ/YmgE (transglycosylase-associated protein family)